MARTRARDLTEPKRYTGYTFLTQMIVLLLAVLFIAPLFIILNYSLKTKKELYVGDPLALPRA